MIIGRQAFFYQLGVDSRVNQFCPPLKKSFVYNVFLSLLTKINEC